MKLNNGMIMYNLKSLDGNIKRLIVIDLLIIVIMTLLMPDIFFTFSNISSMSFQFPELGIFAVAMALAMFTGGIDLSVVGIGNLAAILSGSIILRFIPENATSFQIWIIITLSFVVCLAVGALCGLLNGLFITKANIHPILTTLATMLLFSGIGIIITKGTSLYGFPAQVNKIGNGYLFNIIPIPLIIFIVVSITLAFLIQRTSFGMKLLMIGSSEKTATYSGIDKNKMLIMSYMISGMMASIAGFIILTRTNSASADYGDAYILMAILVAVIGGVDPKGGRGKITAVILAVITVQLLSSGLNLLNINSYFKQLVYGGLLIFLVNQYPFFKNFKFLRSHRPL